MLTYILIQYTHITLNDLFYPIGIFTAARYKYYYGEPTAC